MKKLNYNLTLHLKFGADEKAVAEVTELLIEKLSPVITKINELEDIEAATLDVPGQSVDEDPVDLLTV